MEHTSMLARADISPTKNPLGLGTRNALSSIVTGHNMLQPRRSQIAELLCISAGRTSLGQRSHCPSIQVPVPTASHLHIHNTISDRTSNQSRWNSARRSCLRRAIGTPYMYTSHPTALPISSPPETNTRRIHDALHLYGRIWA